jgi:hypothetical protein
LCHTIKNGPVLKRYESRSPALQKRRLEKPPDRLVSSEVMGGVGSSGFTGRI